jgi:putative Mg2+ transporter-C (MgtC) family protein
VVDTLWEVEWLTDEFSLDWRMAIIDLLRVAIAFALAMPIAWERHKSDRDLGLRTFPIVAIGACGFMLTVKHLPGATPDMQSRVLQGLLSGIGFIGGGAILKHGTNVRGLATAASIWCTGAIGAAVAYGREEIAIVLSTITFATLRLLTPISEKGGYDGTDDEGKNRDADAGK